MSQPFKPLRFSRAGLRGLKISATLLINDRVRELWAEGRNVYHLGFGESRFPVHQKIADALKDNVQKRSYLPALGIPEVRTAIAEYYQRKFQIDCTPDQVVIGPGSKPLIWALFLALGEEIILTQPSWVTYAPQSHLLAKPVTWVPTRPETGYRLEIDVLEEVVEEARNGLGNPEVLVINSPMNPTGTMIPPDSLQEIADFARAHEMVVISDEIYALTVHGEMEHESIARYYPEGSIVLGGLSKNLSMGGWRFGLAIHPPGAGGQALRSALQTLATNTWTCVTAPVQYAALTAYADDPEIDEYVGTCSTMHTIRTRYLYQTMAGLGVPCVEPQGGFYIYPSFERWAEPLAAKGIETDADLAMYLLDKYEIAALPGSDFNSAQPFCLRMSSSYIDAATDADAENLLEAYRADPDPVRFIQDHHPRLHEAADRLGEFLSELESV